jgi:hypothetical protein
VLYTQVRKLGFFVGTGTELANQWFAVVDNGGKHQWQGVDFEDECQMAEAG